MQRRLQRLITDPDGVEAALAAVGDREGTQLAALLCGGEVPAPARLAVYANAYFVRIRDCLGTDFGALAAALGEAAFHDLVKTYLMLHPPSRPSLRHAGAQLAAHLRTEPFATIFAKRCAYAADLADLEWAIAEAFYAPDAPAIGPDSLAAIPPDAWAQLHLELTPSLRILRCEWPVDRVRDRFDASPGARETKIRSPPDRHGFASGDRTIAFATGRSRRWKRQALEAAAAGRSFGDLCEIVAASVGEAETPRFSADLVASWFAAGLVVGRH